jgi:hypothetical protein
MTDKLILLVNDWWGGEINDEFELIECMECKNEFLLNMDEAPLGFYCPYCSTAHEWEE